MNGNKYVDLVRCHECRVYFPLEMGWIKENEFKDKFVVCPDCVEVRE